jgi:hypothetical protein
LAGCARGGETEYKRREGEREGDREKGRYRERVGWREHLEHFRTEGGGARGALLDAANFVDHHF